MSPETDENPVLLSTLPADRRQQRIALAVVLALAALFVLAAPFARIPLTRIPAFIAVYESALVIIDLMTATLLISQYMILRSRSLAVLAAGYLFTASITVAHALTFPGVFAPTGLLGAGPQSTAWLYVFWHASFPLVVIVAAWLRSRPSDRVRGRGGEALVYAATALAATVVFTAIATSDVIGLRPLFTGDVFTTGLVWAQVLLLSLCLLALAVQWPRRTRSVLDLWLGVTMCVWLFDIALSTLFNAARFDLGFYAGRAYGLLGAASILIILLLENGWLYAQLAKALSGERRERHRAQLSESRFGKLVDLAPDSIVKIDGERRIGLMNRATEKIFGWSRSELLGKTIEMLLPLPSRATGQGVMPIVGRRKGGHDVELEVVMAPLDAADGDGVVAIMRDVTEHRGREREIQHAAKLQSLGQLAGGIAHDINNQLGAVVANLDLLNAAIEADPDKKELIDVALDAALKSSDLIERLLAFSREQASELKPIDLAVFLKQAMPLLARTIGEAIVIDVAVPPDTSKMIADQVQLQNCLSSLASNARDAMPKGGRLTIGCRNLTVDERAAAAYPDLAPGRYVVMSVTDTGMGIPPEIIARVLEPFFTTKAVGAGSGLGLSMVYGIMRRSGGTVKIQSKVGKGTTVSLYLPALAEAEKRPEPVEAKANAAAAPGSARILVVDDNDGMRRGAAATLRSLGYATAEAPTGDAALALLESGERFDLIFSDIMMPGNLTGPGLARVVRDRGWSSKFVFTTGFSGPVDMTEELATSGGTILQKPYRKAALAQTMRTALGDPTPASKVVP